MNDHKPATSQSSAASYGPDRRSAAVSAISLALALGSLAFAFYLWHELRETQRKVGILQAEQAEQSEAAFATTKDLEAKARANSDAINELYENQDVIAGRVGIPTEGAAAATPTPALAPLAPTPAKSEQRRPVP